MDEGDRHDPSPVADDPSLPAASVLPARPLVSLVLPMYNEEAVVERSLRTVLDHLRTMADRYDFEVLVVDDGSTDATRAQLERIADDEPKVRVLPHPTNFRLGQALRFAFGASRGDVVVTFDADLSYSVDHIDRLVDHLVAERARIVIASPYMPGGRTVAIPRSREVLSRTANRFLSLTALGRLHTVTGMVRAYDGPFIRTLDLKAVDVDVNTEIIYKAQVLRARIDEIPATLDWSGSGDRRRIPGFNRRIYWATAKQMVLGFLFRPFLFFAVPGLLLLLLSSALGLHVLLTAVSERRELDSWAEAVRSATSLEAAGIAGAAVSFVLAVVLLALSVVTFQAKRYFEELYHLSTTLRRELSDEPALQRRRSLRDRPAR